MLGGGNSCPSFGDQWPGAFPNPANWKYNLSTPRVWSRHPDALEQKIGKKVGENSEAL